MGVRVCAANLAKWLLKENAKDWLQMVTFTGHRKECDKSCCKRVKISGFEEGNSELWKVST